MSEPPLPIPPIKDPIRDEDDGDKYDWYYDESAGGLTFWFGMYPGRKLHEVRLSYIDWCRETLTKSNKVRVQQPVL